MTINPYLYGTQAVADTSGVGEHDRDRYDEMIESKIDEADAALYDLIAGVLEDESIPYQETALRRMVSVEGLFASPQHTDAGRVREAIARLTDTDSFETWRETCDDGGAS